MPLNGTLHIQALLQVAARVIMIAASSMNDLSTVVANINPAITNIVWAKRGSQNRFRLSGLAERGLNYISLPSGVQIHSLHPKPHKTWAGLPCRVEYQYFLGKTGFNGALLLFNVILKAGFMLATTVYLCRGGYVRPII